MKKHTRITFLLAAISAFLLLLLLLLFFVLYLCRRNKKRAESAGIRSFQHSEGLESEDLITFPGGENLTSFDILNAPGEVVGKSSYGTLYKAYLQSGSVVLLRFLHPACTERAKDISWAVEMLGHVRHPNLVPLQGFYSGPKGEKLILHPFFSRGTLAHFLRDGSRESHRWTIIYRISLGIAEGLDHLHTGLQKPIIHGNLKSKNIILDSNYQSHLSDFGLHLILNPTAGREMLKASADQGYKAPELIKMKDASKESDIYSLGVIFLEILTGKEPIYRDSSTSKDYLPTSMRNAILSHKVPEIFNSELLKQSNSQKVMITEEVLLNFFHLAMACCYPSPSLRPGIKQVISKLKEIGQ